MTGPLMFEKSRSIFVRSLSVNSTTWPTDKTFALKILSTKKSPSLETDRRNLEGHLPRYSEVPILHEPLPVVICPRDNSPQLGRRKLSVQNLQIAYSDYGNASAAVPNMEMRW